MELLMAGRARDLIEKAFSYATGETEMARDHALTLLAALDAAGLEVREQTDGRREWMLKAAVWHENAAFQCDPESAAFHNDCAGTLRLVHDMEQRRAMIAKGQG